MTIRKVQRRGETRLFLDIVYKRKDGTRARFRRDAEVQTMAGARAEERRILANIAQYGEPYEPQVASPKEEVSPITFDEALALYRSGKAVTELKPSTRAGYEEIIGTRLLPRFKGQPLVGITYEEVQNLDAEMVSEGLSASRRRNVQITVRSIIRGAVEAGWLEAMPKLPDLPKKGKKKLIPFTVDQVEKLLDVSPPSQRLAFSLAAYAGLRAGEVRALRWVDVDLEQGILIVRFSESKGELSTPKSGHEREIPLAPQLRTLLKAMKGQGRGLVSTTGEGEPWGECGLNQALKRAAKKAGIEGAWRFHDLRHFFVTQLFRRGGGAPAVQSLAGHLHLSTTQIYAHTMREDLRATIGLFGADAEHRGNSVATAPPAPT